ncbi:MAG: 2-amino-4-hydroxy-6-hydroxymethyldihydropteridine diphosphokinase [Proteobacteria bacterium]|nr:2-amino-4-hydroxy-6-hydroxymethyldihydropteridine diphosphokinase [Pseudomonadota bacterium]
MPLLSLSLGSNIDPAENIRRAARALQQEFGEITCSAVFESEAIGFDGDNFLNLVVITETQVDLQPIVLFLKQLEDQLGRDRTQPRFSGRPIDIDILSFGDETGHDCGIELPRAEITRNAFVLKPLAELLPDVVHKETGRTHAALWEAFDKAGQRLWRVDFDWQDT